MAAAQPSPKPGEFPGQVLEAILQATKQEQREPQAQKPAIRDESGEAEQMCAGGKLKERARGSEESAPPGAKALKKNQ